MGFFSDIYGIWIDGETSRVLPGKALEDAKDRKRTHVVGGILESMPWLVFAVQIAVLPILFILNKLFGAI